MRARDLMTTGVVTVPPDAPVHTVAGIMAERSATGVPVVDASGALLGLVTESDLLRRLAAAEDAHHAWLWGMFRSAARQAGHYAKTHGRRARDVMTTHLVTATEDTTAEHISRVMEERRIRHLPVVRDGKLVGLVTRAGLLRAVLAPPGQMAADAPDAVIRRNVLVAMREQPWADAEFTFVDVRDGVVTFSGFCRSEEVQRALRVLAEEVPGVKDVVFHTRPTPRFMIGVP